MVVRAQFINNGKLADSQDINFRAVSNNWPVFAFSRDLGSITSTTNPVVFSVGHIRDPVIQYIVANAQIQPRSLYFWSQFPSSASVVCALVHVSSSAYLDISRLQISAFLGDYEDALNRAQVFDSQVASDATKVSEDYASIVALSIRQALGATEITVSKNSNETYNTNDVLVFMKG